MRYDKIVVWKTNLSHHKRASHVVMFMWRKTMQIRKITAATLPLILLISFLLIPAAWAQEETTVVQAVLFYSPSCGHCHHVITEVLPPLMERYEDQLQVIGVNTYSQEGQTLYQAAIDTFEIPVQRQGVPTLIVGESVLVGSGEIPEQFPEIIEEGLAQGGISWPDIPGLEEAIVASRAVATEQAQATQTAEAAPTETADPTAETASSTEDASPSETTESLTQTEVPEEATATPTKASSPNVVGLDDSFPQERSFVVKFKRDLVGNSFSVVLLVIMIVSVILVWLRLLQDTKPTFAWPSWIVPVLCAIGVVVAAYLSYVEVTQTEAVCGPVGDCNTVQQSPYATLFGFLPVGVLGLIGYVVIIAVWLIQQYGPQQWHFLAAQALWGMAFFGTLFSIYLTFLEPFVIGATCAWCLTSAVIMTLLLWVSTNDLRHALAEDPEMELDHA
jgi:uncharacterized membrane protein/thiol-disulfide isomerase/thioredoxin